MSGEVVRCAVCDNQMFMETLACAVCGTPNPYAHLVAGTDPIAQPTNDAPLAGGHAEASLQPSSVSTPFDLDLVFPTAPAEPTPTPTGGPQASDPFELDLSSLFAWDDTPASSGSPEMPQTEEQASTPPDNSPSILAEVEAEPLLAAPAQTDYPPADVVEEPIGELLPSGTVERASLDAEDAAPTLLDAEPNGAAFEYSESAFSEASEPIAEEALSAIWADAEPRAGDDIATQEEPEYIEQSAPESGQAQEAQEAGESAVAAIVDFEVEPQMVSGEMVDYEVDALEVGQAERLDTEPAPAQSDYLSSEGSDTLAVANTTDDQPPQEEPSAPEPEVVMAPAQESPPASSAEPVGDETEPQRLFDLVAPEKEETVSPEPDVLQTGSEIDTTEESGDFPPVIAVEEPLEPSAETGEASRTDEAVDDAAYDAAAYDDEVTSETTLEAPSDPVIGQAAMPVSEDTGYLEDTEETIAPIAPAELEAAAASDIALHEEPTGAVPGVEPQAFTGEVSAEVQEGEAPAASAGEQPELVSGMETPALHEQVSPGPTDTAPLEPAVAESGALGELASEPDAGIDDALETGTSMAAQTYLVDALADAPAVEETAAPPLEETSDPEQDYDLAATATAVEPAAQSEVEAAEIAPDNGDNASLEYPEQEPGFYPVTTLPEPVPERVEEAQPVLLEQPAPVPYEPAPASFFPDWALPVFEQDVYPSLPEDIAVAPQASEYEAAGVSQAPPAPDSSSRLQQFAYQEDLPDALAEDGKAHALQASDQAEGRLTDGYVWSPNMEMPTAVPVELPQETYPHDTETPISQTQAQEQPELEPALHEEGVRDDLSTWKPGDEVAGAPLFPASDAAPNGSIYYSQTTSSAASPEAAHAYSPGAQPAWDPSTPRPMPGTPEYNAMVQQALAARGLRANAPPVQPAQPSQPAAPAFAVQPPAASPAWSTGMPKPQPGTPEYEELVRQALAQRLSGQGAGSAGSTPPPAQPAASVPATDPNAPRPKPGTPEYEELVRRALAQKFNKQS